MALTVTPAVGAVGTAGSHAAVGQSDDCTFPVTATDATGTEVTVDERPERVTTLNPSAAQTMWEIGGKSQVVGVTQFASYLDGAGERANVSAAGFGVSVEKVVGTEPDLVLAPSTTSNQTVSSLREAGLTVFKFGSAETIDDVAAKTTLTGQLTGNCEGAAETNAWMQANVEEAQRVTGDRERVSVLYPLGSGFFAGRGTFINAMLRASGAENALPAEDEFDGFPEVNEEVVITSEPDVLVVTGFTSGLLGASPYTELEAVQNDEIVQVNRNWMNQPAPRSVVFGVRNLTSGLHSEAAESADFPSRDEVSVNTPTPTATATPAATATPTATEAMTATDTLTAESTETSGPGFGVVLAAVSLLLAGLVGIRRTR